MNLTDLFGKQIFAIYEGETVGTISGANFDKDFSCIRSFRVFDHEENEFELLISNIKSMSDFVIINNISKLDMACDNQKKSPMFKLVLDEKGKDFGKIINANINDKGEVLNYITNKGINLSPCKMYFRKDFIYYSEAKVKISNLRPRTKKIDPINIKVRIFNLEEKNNNFIPTKASYNPSSIIGKIAKGDLFGINNEVIIKANQTITEKIIDDASRHNRLNQLFYLAI